MQKKDRMRRICLDRHNGKINIAFMDTTVNGVSLKNLWDLRWHAQWNRTSALPYQSGFSWDDYEWMDHIPD